MEDLDGCIVLDALFTARLFAGLFQGQRDGLYGCFSEIEFGGIVVGEVEHGLGQRQHRQNVGNVLELLVEVEGQDLGVRVARDVGLNRHRDVAQVD